MDYNHGLFIHNEGDETITIYFIDTNRHRIDHINFWEDDGFGITTLEHYEEKIKENIPDEDIVHNHVLQEVSTRPHGKVKRYAYN